MNKGGTDPGRFEPALAYAIRLLGAFVSLPPDRADPAGCFVDNPDGRPGSLPLAVFVMGRDHDRPPDRPDPGVRASAGGTLPGALP